MALFEDSINTVLENEGGYVNDQNDSGGETNFGISKKSYPNLDIKSLTVEDAKAIYLRDFWKFGGITSQPVATKLLDSYVNMGHNAIKIAQRLVNMDDDGIFGTKTEHAINLETPEIFLSRYRIDLVNYYLDIVKVTPSKAKFLLGWLRRARQ